MGKDTDIQWSDSSLNLQMGCDGCELWNLKAGIKTCYSGKLHEVYAGSNKGWPESFDKPKLFLDRLEPALRWSDLTGKERPAKPWLNGMPRMVFLDDMGDTFTESLPLEWLAPLLPEMGASPHQWMLLTKRANRMEEFSKLHPFPKNFWLMTSITSNANLNRIAHLERCQGGGPRVISYEPAFEWVDFEYPANLYPDGPKLCCSGQDCGCMGLPVDPPEYDLDGIIVGGASGFGAAAFDIQWVRKLINQFHKRKTKIFVKQLGSTPVLPVLGGLRETEGKDWPEGTRFGNRTGKADFNGRQILLRDSKGGSWEEWSEDLRVRNLPAVSQ